MKHIAAMLMLGATAIATAQPPAAPATPGQQMAATVLQQWPVATHDQWAYEEGTVLDGIAAQWHVTANGDDFAYIKAAVDKYVTADGAITTYKASGHTLDDVEMGRADLLLYRVTQQDKYAKCRQVPRGPAYVQPRTASGGYWHKQTLPQPDVARRPSTWPSRPSAPPTPPPSSRSPTSTTSPSNSC